MSNALLQTQPRCLQLPVVRIEGSCVEQEGYKGLTFKGQHRC